MAAAHDAGPPAGARISGFENGWDSDNLDVSDVLGFSETLDVLAALLAAGNLERSELIKALKKAA